MLRDDIERTAAQLPVLFLACTILADPRAKGRPRSTKNGGTYTPPATRAAEKTVRKKVKAAMDGRQPTAAPVLVELAFHCGTARRVDLDNLAKLALDSANGIAFVDDAQIVELRATKAIDRARPRTVIRVYELPHAQETLDAA
jgi:Holliday junction resolvase RusA-like endonuclease